MDRPLLAQPISSHETGTAEGGWIAAVRRGDFAAAWAINDAVLAARDPATRDDPALPYHERWVWDGTPLAGRHVLVRCYHGLGDTLQFSRFLPELVRVAAAVVVEVQAALLPLLGGVRGVRLHAFDPGRPLPRGEAEVEVMELSHALRAWPDPAPYLAGFVAAPGLAPCAGGAGGTGFCWAAGGWGAARNMPAAALLPVARGRRAVSLQRGDAAIEAASIGAIDPLEGSMDMGRLAGLVAGLDAVVTIDTMVAHVAGGLGVPTYVLLQHDPDWRWGEHGSPWYRTVRTFRQPAPGDWAGAVERLRGTLDRDDCS